MNDNYKEEYDYEDDEKKFRITRGMLIAAILVLIIIVIIIVVIVRKINSKKPLYVESDFKKLERRMVEESPNYITQKNLDLDNGDIEINLKDLLVENGGSIDKNAVKAAKICDGYVIASKNDEITYSPYISCEKYYTTNGYKTKEKKEITTKKERDVIKPDITIIGEEKITIDIGVAYNDQGAKAVDNIDGDITSKMKASNNVDINKEGTYSVVYTVTDKAGNRAEKIRTVTVVSKANETTHAPATTTRNYTTTRGGSNRGSTRETNTTKKATTRKVTTPPTLTLRGYNPVIINAGTAYNEAGYKATDALGKDITSKVVVTGGVNTSIPKTYTIKYTVVDDYGNKTSVSRLVNVKSNTIKLKSISVTPNSKTLKVGEKYRINVIFNPSNATNKSLAWISNNANVASVNYDGTVTAHKKGVTKIIVTPVGASRQYVEIIVK